MNPADPRSTPTSEEVLALFAQLQEKTAAATLLLEEVRGARSIAEAERSKAAEAHIAAAAELAAAKVQRVQAEQAAKASGSAQKIAEEAKDKAVAAQAVTATTQVAAEAEHAKAVAASAAATTASELAVAQKNETIEAVKAVVQAQSDVQAAKVSATTASADAVNAKVASEAELAKVVTSSGSATEALEVTKVQQKEIIVAAKAAAVAKTNAEASSQQASEASKAAIAGQEKAAEELGKVNAIVKSIHESHSLIADLESKSVIALEEIDKKNKSIQGIEELARGYRNLAESAANTATGEAKKAAEAHDLAIVAGLAGAFNKKAIETNERLLLWVIVLIGALFAVGLIGYGRYADLKELVANKPDNWMLGAQVFLTIFGVGAPVWLAWIATKMISMNFVISSDYAYKASLAQAYTGFREQAKGLDPLLEQRLLAAAITQLDANPVRFVDDRHPGTPLQELLQQPFMQEVLQATTFKHQLIEWFKSRFKLKLMIPDSPAQQQIPRDIRSTAVAPPVAATPPAATPPAATPQV